MTARVKRRRKSWRYTARPRGTRTLTIDGDGLFRYSSGVDQNDLLDEAPRYCYKKVGMMQLKTILPSVFEMRVIV